ncbi:WD40 repeat domain-containing protein [Streptomyces sp. 21So2-11]|uniref:WD40 repeat domain-containing protein n=1 Tax=Streptomyces sp. 21So2-11 TaxID=3144408 RepID=UPI00321A279B
MHAVVPLTGHGVLGTVWTLADQLGVVARSPSELVAALQHDQRRTVIVLPDLHAADDAAALAELAVALADVEHVRLVVEARSGHRVLPLLGAAGPAVMDLDEAQWTEPARYEARLAAQDRSGPHPAGGRPADPLAPLPDLEDPAAVCAADPVHVTAAYEVDGAPYGGLRAAWLRAGQSLLHHQPPAERALVLLTALGDGADPRLAPELAQLAAGASWELVWGRVCGDISPPWPGPVFALTLGNGPLEGQILLSDHQGVLRTVALSDAVPTGRLIQRIPQTMALSSLPDGTVWALDSQGSLHTQKLSAARPVSGLTALLDDGPTPVEQAADALTTLLAQTSGTAMAATENLAALADASGTVHTLTIGAPDAAPRTALLHEGPVTALAAVDLPLGESGPSVPLLYSGGADGRVRVWAPEQEPLAAPVAERSCPVVALSCAHTPVGLVLAAGWADGLVEYHRLDAGEMRSFRPGPPVSGLAVTPGGHLVIGTDEAVFCLRPR